ncbi:putative copper-importing P-type ATPase A [Rubripirellula lacrimiformis]|uniref:Putative copper-importing P-type ATPase A n=1 Tax=Rubripirellula lacrimiformis TaxID=1930273 RepID=A0A517NA04_9BACT|nr:heavy metal translocating P-type ATPase metal-binding domain-containing protein [Rubripirellula lacrimiformis]QDT03838.1 putative copper-importing P-type ATPase A [Rubripirellula lacrimiformis]
MSSPQVQPTPRSESNQTHRPVQIDCVHCGLATPCQAGTDPQTVFCCNGCRGAYELIHGWGLSDFYALRDQSSSSEPHPAAGAKSRYDAFENQEFLGLSTPVQNTDGTCSTELAVHGLHCAACAWLIENAATRTDGWHVARVRMSDHTLRVQFDPATVRLGEIACLMDRLGYQVAPISKDRTDHFRIENQRLLIQIAIAGFCAANAMWIAIALYAGEASGVASDHRLFLRIVGTVLGVVAVLIPGQTFFRGAFAALRTGTPHMDLPVALGLSVGTVAGLVSAFVGTGDVYFDSLAVLVFLLLIGRWIQFHQQHRAAKAVDLLLRITPAHAQRLSAAGEPEWVLVDTLQPSDVIRVSPGESVAADGRIVAGESMFDRSLLTGESRPIPASTGDEVAAGTLNLVRPIDVEVIATGRDSRIGKVMQSVESAASAKTPVVQLADRIGGVFVVVVTLLAIVTLILWSSSDWALAASHATSLLIVACPCALALATPLAIAVSLGRAAKRKILIRDGSSLQQLARPGMVWFDKTGTLTEGRPRAELWMGTADAVRLAARLEQDCCHPTAEAIVRFAATLSDDPGSGTGIDRGAGGESQSIVDVSDPVDLCIDRRGVSGIVDGQSVVVGNLNFMNDHSVLVERQVAEAAESCLQSGASPTVVAVDGHALAVLGVSDPLKSDAAETVADLQGQGFRVGILSGDHPAIVQMVARQVGIDPALAIGGQSPEEKLARVVSGQSESQSVVMIGDGANDAAALAAADVGIAVRGGAEVSLQAAPIFIASGQLKSLGMLMRGGRRTSRLIQTGFAVSLSYNVVAVGLAVAGRISPLLAAILMPISSVSVLTLVLVWPIFGSASETQETSPREQP